MLCVALYGRILCTMKSMIHSLGFVGMPRARGMGMYTDPEG
jgi:hypothetical protein